MLCLVAGWLFGFVFCRVDVMGVWGLGLRSLKLGNGEDGLVVLYIQALGTQEGRYDKSDTAFIVSVFASICLDVMFRDAIRLTEMLRDGKNAAELQRVRRRVLKEVQLNRSIKIASDELKSKIKS